MGSTEYAFSFREFVRLIFYKKICPVCNSKLNWLSEKKLIKLGWKKMHGTFWAGKHYEGKIVFHCDKCDRRFELMELKKHSSPRSLG